MRREQGRDWTAPFRIDGNGDDALVLIHGFTGHPGHWIPLGEMLVDHGYTVTVPLLSGHGGDGLAGSVWREWVASARAAVESVRDHRRLHLVGLSMGGLIAILLARPTAASSLVTINSPMVLRELKAYLAPVARHLVPFLPSPPDEVPDPDLAHLWIPLEHRSTAAVDQLLRVMWRAWWEAGRLRRPGLVIQSRRDEAVRAVSGPMLARRLRAGLLWVETRHNALLDPQRTVVCRAIVDHVEGVRTGGTGRVRH